MKIPKHEYWVWAAMVQRCTNPKNSAYANYGGRGIAVCERWRSSAAFFADMGPRPSPQHTLERVNNSGGYGPDNCQWVSRSDNNRNKRRYRNNASGVAGVHWRPEIGKWRARIRQHGRLITIGHFDSLTGAEAAWKETAARFGFAPDHGARP